MVKKSINCIQGGKKEATPFEEELSITEREIQSVPKKWETKKSSLEGNWKSALIMFLSPVLLPSMMILGASLRRLPPSNLQAEVGIVMQKTIIHSVRSATPTVCRSINSKTPLCYSVKEVSLLAKVLMKGYQISLFGETFKKAYTDHMAVMTLRAYQKFLAVATSSTSIKQIGKVALMPGLILDPFNPTFEQRLVINQNNAWEAETEILKIGQTLNERATRENLSPDLQARCDDFLKNQVALVIRRPNSKAAEREFRSANESQYTDRRRATCEWGRIIRTITVDGRALYHAVFEYITNRYHYHG